MSVPVVLGTIALAPEIVNLLGGSEFSEAAAPLRIVMAGGGFLFLNAFLGASMVAIDRQRDLVVLNLVALSLNVALNVILIPPFGYIAAASVAAVSELAAFAGSLYLVHKRTSFRPRLSVTVRALIAGGVMFGVVWLVPVHFTISVLLGIAVYGVMTVVLGLHRAVELHTIFGSAGAG